RADRGAEQQPDRLYQCILCRRDRLCADLAHLVVGGGGNTRRVRNGSRLRVPKQRGNRNIRRPASSVRSRAPRGVRRMNIAVGIENLRPEVLRPEALPTVSEAGPAPTRTVVAYGFWIFILSDIVMFAALFAAYAVLVRATAGGATGAQLFNQVTVAIETGVLLASSYACGLMSLDVNSRRRTGTYLAAIATFVLGAAFLGIELREFGDMIARGATPQSSAFLSAFFTLGACPGRPGPAGFIWLVVMMVQVAVKDFTPAVTRRLLCFALFWHALD